MGEVMRHIYDSQPKVVNTSGFGRNDRFVARNSADRAPGFREPPDTRPKSRQGGWAVEWVILTEAAGQGSRERPAGIG